MKRALPLFLLVALIIPNEAFAARMMEMQFIGQPTMLLKDGAITSCGLRFVGLQSPANPADKKESLWGADASFNLRKNGAGVVKAIAQTATVNDIMSKTLGDNLKFKSFWMKAPNTSATKPISQILDSDKNAKYYAVGMQDILSLYEAFLDEKPIIVGFDFDDDIRNVALFGKITMSTEGYKQSVSCFSELIESMQKEVEANTNPN